MLSKPSTAPAAPAPGGAFGAKAGPFGVQAGGTFGVQPAPAKPAVDPAKAASEAVRKEKPRYFTTEHFLPASGYEKEPSAKTRINGPEVVDLKQRPLVKERAFLHYMHYTVVLDGAKHTVPTYWQSDVPKVGEVFPRPGPDNLFEMLAILAIELKVPVLFSSD